MHHFRQGIKNMAEICVQHNVRTAIISPGSRNAPLIFAFVEHPEMECISVADERSAGYIALGISLQTGNAVAIVCTSGTAALNYAPAIAEAYYQNIPLVVITADRPAEWVDQADGQTLRQTGIFANYIKASFDLPVDTSNEVDLAFCNRQISTAIDTAKNFPCGPVHINVPLREPIYCALPEKHNVERIIRTMEAKTMLAENTLQDLQSIWKNSARKLIVFGVSKPNAKMQELAQSLALRNDCVVVAENISNISGKGIITQPETFFASLSADEQKCFCPDLLISIGNSIICKQLKQFLRQNKAAEQWQFHAAMPYVDTYLSLTKVITASATEILSQMPASKEQSTYNEQFATQMQKANQWHEIFVNKNELSDMTAVAQLLQTLPINYNLHLANSTAVRWTQLFAARPDLAYYCNRGTSGIDGSTSTAVGFAHAAQSPTLFLSGDVSFIYDGNAFWNNIEVPNLKIIVLNNNGGNIFRFIGDKTLMAQSIDFFTTPNNSNIELLAKAHGLDYLNCNSFETLDSSLQKLYGSKTCTVLEIFTNADLNTENYSGYFKNLKNCFNSAL